MTAAISLVESQAVAVLGLRASELAGMVEASETRMATEAEEVKLGCGALIQARICALRHSLSPKRMRSSVPTEVASIFRGTGGSGEAVAAVDFGLLCPGGSIAFRGGGGVQLVERSRSAQRRPLENCGGIHLGKTCCQHPFQLRTL